MPTFRVWIDMDDASVVVKRRACHGEQSQSGTFHHDPRDFYQYLTQDGRWVRIVEGAAIPKDGFLNLPRRGMHA